MLQICETYMRVDYSNFVKFEISILVCNCNFTGSRALTDAKTHKQRLPAYGLVFVGSY